ncbi:MAG: LCP family protein [Chloroflexi bacterium]|nr:LCP family protein [Chloroflexota bacterium]
MSDETRRSERPAAEVTRPHERPSFHAMPTQQHLPPVFDEPRIRPETQANQPTDHMPPPIAQPLPVPAKPRRRWLGLIAKVGLFATLAGLSLMVLVVLVYVVFPPPRTNILILGIDAREGQGTAVRTDTIILTTVDPAQPYIGMLSIPRDLYVEIPGYAPGRINTANALGELESPPRGPQLTAETVDATFGVPVDYTIRIDFQGFVDVVDAAGGVTVVVEESFTDFAYPTADGGTTVVSFEAGEQVLDGERALQYARVRHDSSDFARSARQQQLLAALIRELMAPRNWSRWPAVYQALQANADSSISAGRLILLAPAALIVGPDRIDQRTLSFEMTTGVPNEAGASYLQPRWEIVGPLIDEMFHR